MFVRRFHAGTIPEDFGNYVEFRHFTPTRAHVSSAQLIPLRLLPLLLWAQKVSSSAGAKAALKSELSRSISEHSNEKNVFSVSLVLRLCGNHVLLSFWHAPLPYNAGAWPQLVRRRAVSSARLPRRTGATQSAPASDVVNVYYLLTKCQVWDKHFPGWDNIDKESRNLQWSWGFNCIPAPKSLISQ